MKYLIWSFKHDCWWAPNSRGYTPDIELAGRYSAHDAGEIVTNSILLESIAICEPIATEQGPPKFHPHYGPTDA